MTRECVVSVIIPSFQAQAVIARCLHALLAQQTTIHFEVIVVDSGTDGAAEIVRTSFPGVRLIHSTLRLDPAAARNRGVAVAAGSILAFIDADCIPPHNWLDRLCAWVDEGNDAVGGAIGNAEPSSSASWAGYFCEFREFLPRGTPKSASNLTIGNSAYRRAAFVTAGGFPEGYFPQEDQVFHSALRANGARIWYDPAIVVAHTHRSRITDFLRHQTRIGSANARVARTLLASGRWPASHPAGAWILLPALSTVRFIRTVAACWRFQECLIIRRPQILFLCWLGMLAWAIGFARASAPPTGEPA